MQNTVNSQPWWKRTNRQTLDDRVKSVQNVNDKSIVADNVQRYSTLAMYALLAFTTFLSTFSYFKFFESSFGSIVAGIMAVLLALVIEFGKNWGTLKVLRIPFFCGWGHVMSEVHHSIMFLGLLLLSIVTFSASVYNSTHGAAQLSLLLGHEKHTEIFTPETAIIDAQILATQKSMTANRDIKWKGTVTYQAQKAIQKESGALDKLQNQRSAIIQQQRADYEGRQAVFTEQNNFSSNSLLAVGGWVELLQLILMFVRVAAERSLDQTAAERTDNDTILSQPFKMPANRQPVNNRSPIGFKYGQGGEKTVTQQRNTVPQAPQEFTIMGCDEILKNCEKKLRSDIPNFTRTDTKSSTVSVRVKFALDLCFEALKRPDFVPSRKVGCAFYAYMVQTAIPALNHRGFPYENDKFFLKRILEVIPEQ